MNAVTQHKSNITEAFFLKYTYQPKHNISNSFLHCRINLVAILSKTTRVSNNTTLVGNVEWLKRRDCDQLGFGSTSINTCAILLCP